MSDRSNVPTIIRPRYRKMSTQVWADDRVRQLSAPPPNAQTLWFFLLLGPHARTLPGLFVHGQASLAEQLHWSRRGTLNAWREIETAGLALADWSAGVVWIPKAIRHNPPENPNVIKGWRNPLAEIPSCELKTMAVRQLKEFCKGLGKGFAEAFPEGFDKEFGKSVTVAVAVPGRVSRLQRENPDDDDPAKYDPGTPDQRRRDTSDGGPAAPASGPVRRRPAHVQRLLDDANAIIRKQQGH